MTGTTTATAMVPPADRPWPLLPAASAARVGDCEDVAALVVELVVEFVGRDAVDVM